MKTLMRKNYNPNTQITVKSHAGFRLTISVFLFIAVTTGFAQIQKPTQPPKVETEKKLPEISREYKPDLKVIEFKTTTPSGIIALGDEETLKWTIEGRDWKDIYVEIRPLSGLARTQIRTDLSGGRFRIEGSQNVKPTSNTTYTLHVKGTPLQGTTSQEKVSFPVTTPALASVEVKVRSPKLENVQPEIDPKDLNIKFFVKNTGETDFRPTRIEISYYIEGIEGLTPSSFLRNGTLTTSAIGIRRGEKKEIGNISLPDRRQALSHDKLRIRVSIEAMYDGRERMVDQDDFVVPWKQSSINLGHPILLQIANSLLRNLKFQINNYGSQSSYIELPGLVDTKRFDIPEIRKELKLDFGFFGEWHWGWYRIWVRDINNAPFSEDALSIGEGGIRFIIPVETNGPTEIKCVYDPLDIGGYTDDTACPDLDIRGPVNVKVVLIPGVVDGQIVYSRVNVDCTIRDTTFPGAWDWFIELFTGDLKPKIESIIESKLKELLESSDVKNAFRDKMLEILKKLCDITRVTKVELTGGDFFVWYL